MNFGLNASRPMGFGKQRQPMKGQKILIVTTNVKGSARTGEPTLKDYCNNRSRFVLGNLKYNAFTTVLH